MRPFLLFDVLSSSIMFDSVSEDDLLVEPSVGGLPSCGDGVEVNPSGSTPSVPSGRYNLRKRLPNKDFLTQPVVNSGIVDHL